MAEDCIAIIGIGCRFPDRINHSDTLLKLLAKGRETISGVPPEMFIALHSSPPPAYVTKV